MSTITEIDFNSYTIIESDAECLIFLLLKEANSVTIVTMVALVRRIELAVIESS